MSAARTMVLSPILARFAKVDDWTLVAPHIVSASFAPRTMPRLACTSMVHTNSIAAAILDGIGSVVSIP